MKLRKLLSCMLALMLTLCMSGLTSLAATETVVFSDDFEREAEDGFYVSNPVLRSYGDNLIANGDFTSAIVKTAGDGTTAYYGVSNASIALENETLKVTTSAISSDGGFTINIPIDYMTAGNIYELEMYVKSDSAYPFKMCHNATNLGHSTKTYYGMNYLQDNGNRLMSSVAAPKYERVVARFSIETTPTQDQTIGDGVTVPTHVPLIFSVDWNFDGRETTSDSLYVDNVKLRRIMNATPSTSTVQVGMPAYSDANLAGKEAQAVMDVMNTTENNKDVTLITAYYNADKSLNSILNIYKTTVAGNSAVTQRIESEKFTIPADLDGDIQVFAWDSTGSLIPYLEKTDSEYVGYAIKESITDHSNLNTNLAGSDVWRYEDSFSNSSGNANSSFTEEIDTATAKSGIASLCIPTVASESQSGMVYTTVHVEPGKTYRLEFYVMPTSCVDSFTFYVSGACGSVPNAKTYSMTGTLNSEFKWQGNLTGETSAEEVTVTNKTINVGARYYGPIEEGNNTGWHKVTYTFTTPPADTTAADTDYVKSGISTNTESGSYWTEFGYNVGIVFGHGANAYKNSSTPKTREYAAWIDDVVLYEITE